MAYTICTEYGDPKPLQMLITNAHDAIRVGEAFTPFWWVCDPCNPSSSRYEVSFRADQDKPTGFHWYQVVTSDDSPADVTFKLAHYAKVIEARKAMDEARREWERLNG